MKTKNRSRIYVFIFAFLVWLALTDAAGTQEIVSGFIIAVIVSLIAGHFLLTTGREKKIFRRIFFFLIYVLKFVWEMIKANLHVAYIVIHPKLPIKPGIVKINTRLKKDSAITVLSNSITLTPGTLTVDVNKEKQEMYIHWINVESSVAEDATRRIGYRFENTLKEVFE